MICPVAAKHLKSTPMAFTPIKFTSWPDLIESLESGELDITFILAPIAIALYEKGLPIKVVLLGHRNGSTLVVKKSLHISGVAGLRGKTVAIPIRFSPHYLTLLSLCDRAHVPIKEINVVEMPPPDMPSALASGAIDAYIVGEPYAAKAEMAGTARVLYYMKDVQPGFISSVLVVRSDVLKKRHDEVVNLIREFYREGLWIEKNRIKAAEIAAKAYNLPEPLIEFVLTDPPDRVSYRDLIPRVDEFAKMGSQMVKWGLLKHAPDARSLIDTSWYSR
ncbi:MAG: ABC transporter substrate-binding protein [Dissulfurimicrobium sp.]|uniref:ABC transporter substrate-binding protein n=1 Tax=Dissulfurimicrobium hydrothermale TaxID=1750598 RepID=UPI001EDC5614|nr:ABC transporter substrate-binding protein [Dissulfurimicrobium hydrothermale]UKL14598.1 ABC transporter substrate-binding protein [Dissulfurimicrobium hydrothermale]